MLHFLAVVAVADTWGPWEDGFVVAARNDAPTDGVLLYAANYEPTATATDSQGVVTTLASRSVTGVGAAPRVALLPPGGGWAPGETVELSVLGYGEDDAEVAALTFTASAEAAPTASAPVVGDTAVGPWSDDTNYPWGCCLPVRTVTVVVTAPDDADVWSWTEIVGRFDIGRPSQITTEEIHTHLATAVGPGLSRLEFVQWEDDRGPQPPCFDVVAMSASDVAGPSVQLCAEDDEVVPAGDDVGRLCGCTSFGSQPATWLVIAAIAALVRMRCVGS